MTAGVKALVAAVEEYVMVSRTGSQSEKVSGAMDAEVKVAEGVGVTLVEGLAVEELRLLPGRQAEKSPVMSRILG
jgi:hypothetical protein